MTSVQVLVFTEIMTSIPSRGAGAYRVATELRKAGYTVQVIDFFTKFSNEEMDRVIDTFVGPNTLAVGYSSTFFSYKEGEDRNEFNKNQVATIVEPVSTINYPYHFSKMLKWFDKMKAKNPKVQIVLGGTKAQYKNGVCDAYSIGYADQSLIEYVRFLDGKNPFFIYDPKLEHLPNNQIAFNGANYTGKFDFTESTIDWHPTDHVTHGETLPIEIARGCIFKCKFCSYPLNGKKKNDFTKPTSVLREEFLKNYHEHGVTRYVYVDDTHNDSIEKLEMLHSIVQSLPFELEYAAYIRHDLIHAHKHTAKLLLESGLRSAIFGIESLNWKAAQSIGKGLHPEKIKELMYWLREDVWKDRVATGSGFIVGLPHDTPETVRDWSEWLMQKDCPIDAPLWKGLFVTVNPKANRAWRSEFDLEFEKFGYSMSPTGFWKSDNFTKESADALAVELSKKKGRTKWGNFNLIMAGTLGYSTKELVGEATFRNSASLYARRVEFIDNYKASLFLQMENSNVLG